MSARVVSACPSRWIAASMPSAQTWNERAETVRAQGTAAVVEATLGRWFTAEFSQRAPETVQAMSSIEQQALDVCKTSLYG